MGVARGGEGQIGWWSFWQSGIFFKAIYEAVLITLATLLGIFSKFLILKSLLISTAKIIND